MKIKKRKRSVKSSWSIFYKCTFNWRSKMKKQEWAKEIKELAKINTTISWRNTTSKWEKVRKVQ